MRIETTNSNTHRPEQAAYIKARQEEMTRRKKQNIMMILSIFAVLLLVFLGLVKLMAPDIDISLGEENLRSEQEDNYRRSVDSRLRMLQQDDEMNLLEHDKDESDIEEDGVVTIPKTEEKVMLELEDEEPVQTAVNDTNKQDVHEEKQHEEPALRKPADIDNSSAKSDLSANSSQAPIPPAEKTYRVYVGIYSTQAQAEVAKGILKDSGLGVSPNVKHAAGGYTLQAGAFSSKEAATNLTNKLLMNNYPARVVSD